MQTLEKYFLAGLQNTSCFQEGGVLEFHDLASHHLDRPKSTSRCRVAASCIDSVPISRFFEFLSSSGHRIAAAQDKQTMLCLRQTPVNFGDLES